MRYWLGFLWVWWRQFRVTVAMNLLHDNATICVNQVGEARAGKAFARYDRRKKTFERLIGLRNRAVDRHPLSDKHRAWLGICPIAQQYKRKPEDR